MERIDYSIPYVALGERRSCILLRDRYDVARGRRRRARGRARYLYNIIPVAVQLINRAYPPYRARVRLVGASALAIDSPRGARARAAIAGNTRDFCRTLCVQSSLQTPQPKPWLVHWAA
eukprot:COSAG02_NODE_2451_length_8826_cov_26.741836_4_plen_119_part_00